jgi:hypothetical protein
VKRCLSLLAMMISTSQAQGGFTILGPDTPGGQAIVSYNMGSGQYVNSSFTSPAPTNTMYLGGPGQNVFDAMAKNFPSWTVGAGAGLSGTFQIHESTATIDGTIGSGGARLTVTYTRGASDPPLGNLEWIQIISTDRPLGGNTSPYVDGVPPPNSDAFPFYWNAGAMDAAEKSGNSYSFEDNPSRPFPADPGPQGGMTTTNWRADLFLASYDGISTSVTIYDGVGWGFTLSRYRPPSGGGPPHWPGGSGFGRDAVPEPGSLALTCIGGLAGIMVTRKRRAA